VRRRWKGGEGGNEYGKEKVEDGLGNMDQGKKAR
jgi:hypothetical protein